MRETFSHRPSRRDWLWSNGCAAATIAADSLLVPSRGNAAAIITGNLPKLANQYYDTPIATNPEAGRFYFPTLTPPFQNRATYRYTLGRNSWALEQLLTFANVTATIRCNVIQLQNGAGGLWVHSPQWPTGEFCSLLDELGTVEHIVLPCNAFEHKAPVKAFVRRYPNAKVWVSPGQYGPLGRCGTTLTDPNTLGYKIDGVLGDPTNPPPPWADEFDIATLYVDLPKNAGPVSEVAFCHRPTKTLVSTDAVVYVPPMAPRILSTYFDQVTMQDRDFWPKSVLQAVFLPIRTDTRGNYPGYEALVDRLVRAPILRAVVDARAPEAVRNWIDKQTDGSWNFDRVLTSHFASPIEATPADVRASFQYLFEGDIQKLLGTSSRLPPIECQDWELLDSINQFIAKTNAGEKAIFDFQRGCIE
ncbi:protein of unknown function DUF4336 containing protein [Nitzschia inconspicua]|uniref:Uncharacterized protein n=1 Tax=Nitzschia inconspicua TaxID=303405 RepID=A0A9K3Q5L6_9STRA|nr:protein of unknown function DUF4336 containing protein [Nitzschia inconspicua]